MVISFCLFQKWLRHKISQLRRVIVLEAEMSAVLMAIGDTNDEDIDLLNIQAVTQDQRIFLLEKDTDEMDDNFEDLEDDELALVDLVDGGFTQVQQ